MNVIVISRRRRGRRMFFHARFALENGLTGTFIVGADIPFDPGLPGRMRDALNAFASGGRHEPRDRT